MGFDNVREDAIVLMMAGESDGCRDLARYGCLLNEGWDAVLGWRFIKGGGVVGYPCSKLCVNRAPNLFLWFLFRVPLDHFTNAFKAYRRTVINGCRPFLSPHFNMTVELPLNTVIRGYSWTVMPITWGKPACGRIEAENREMGSRYPFVILYCRLEKYVSRGDYHKL
jgi:dolichol-phosphate mannosyltransferase